MTRWGHVRAMLLPTVTLSAAYLCNLTRLVRAKMLEALDTDYVRTARAKGLRELPRLWDCTRCGTPSCRS